MYGGIKSEILYTTKFDETSDLGTTYISRENLTWSDMIKAEERFPITEQGYTIGKLLHGNKCQILLGIWTSKSFMSKTHHFRCKSLHSLPKFAPKTKNIQAGNG